MDPSWKAVDLILIKGTQAIVCLKFSWIKIHWPVNPELQIENFWVDKPIYLQEEIMSKRLYLSVIVYSLADPMQQESEYVIGWWYGWVFEHPRWLFRTKCGAQISVNSLPLESLLGVRPITTWLGIYHKLVSMASGYTATLGKTRKPCLCWHILSCQSLSLRVQERSSDAIFVGERAICIFKWNWFWI